MDIRRITPDIGSEEMEKSKEFYAEFLGLNLVMDMQWILTFASASNPTAQVNILKKEAHANHFKVSFSVEVADIDSVYAKAISLGYKIVYPITDEEWGVRRFFVEDPNGVIVNIMTHL